MNQKKSNRMRRAKRGRMKIRELGATRPQVCIAWALSHPEVTTVIGGAERPEHVDDNFQGTRFKLPPEALEVLSAASDAYLKAELAAKQGS